MLEDKRHIKQSEKTTGTATAKTQKRTGGRSIGLSLILLVIALALLGALWAVTDVVDEQTREQSAYTIRETILDTAMQCFAIEGAYPPTLKYLEDNYGLTLNTQDYSVRYEAFASNVMPSVVVIPR